MKISLSKNSLVIACCTLLMAGTLARADGDAEKGKQLYYDYACYACHGYGGIGRKNLANDTSGILSSEALFIRFLRARADMNPEFPTQSMPHYAESSLPDDTALDIYAYIKTLRDDPPEVDEIPAMRAILESAKDE